MGEPSEDFALAILARWGHLDNGFIDNKPCPPSILDTKGENFIDKENVALLCTSMFEE